MIPAVDSILTNDSAVFALVGDRIYRATASQGITQPYIVWSIISNVPENNLSDRPEIDDSRIAIDCYATSQASARQLGEAARDAIELAAHIVMGPVEFYEPDTKLYRNTFDANFWTPR